MARPGFDLQASGLIDDDAGADLILELEGDSLTYLTDYLGLPDIGGSVDLSGRLVGPLDRFQLNLNGAWEDLAWEFVNIDSAVVSAEARNVPSDSVQATINLQGSSLFVKGRRFEEPSALMEADDEKVVFRDFSFSRGDTFVTSSFDVSTVDSITTVLLNHLRIEMPHSTWINAMPSTIVLEADDVSVDSLSATWTWPWSER
jgi:autotransporter translocation and assembly factor TamB